MRVLVFEPAVAGHHCWYLRILLPALTVLTRDVILVTLRGARDSREFQVHLEDLGNVRVEDVVPAIDGGPLESGRKKLRYLTRAIDLFRPDHVYVPSADHLAQVMGLAAFHRWHRCLDVELEGLLLRGGFAYSRRTRRQKLQDMLSLLAIERSPWTRLHILDPIPYCALLKRNRSISSRLRLMPDPVEAVALTRREARRRLGIPEGGRYIGTVGLIDERKGMDRLIRAFATAPLQTTDRLLLVGQASPTMRDLLHGEVASLVAHGRIIAIDNYADNDDFLAAVSACDVISAPYPDHVGSASVVIRAAASERPVVASHADWLDYVVRGFDLGRCCDIASIEAFGRALSAALDAAHAFRLSEAGRRFVAFHSVENFRAIWTSRLRERMGLPAEDRVSWAWVLNGSNAR